jgi:hypothetical protein
LVAVRRIRTNKRPRAGLISSTTVVTQPKPLTSAHCKQRKDRAGAAPAGGVLRTHAAFIMQIELDAAIAASLAESSAVDRCHRGSVDQARPGFWLVRCVPMVRVFVCLFRRSGFLSLSSLLSCIGAIRCARCRPSSLRRLPRRSLRKQLRRPCPEARQPRRRPRPTVPLATSAQDPRAAVAARRRDRTCQVSRRLARRRFLDSLPFFALGACGPHADRSRGKGAEAFHMN